MINHPNRDSFLSNCEECLQQNSLLSLESIDELENELIKPQMIQNYLTHGICEFNNV